MKKTLVMSLGGSLIVPDEIDLKLISRFKSILEKHKSNYKFVIVCGGGSVARKYIKALSLAKKSEFLQSMVGISVTRLNARFLSYFFGKDANEGIPHDMEQVKNLLIKNDFVFCGSLRYAPNQTSDSTSAQLANFLKCEFVNLTLVQGLFTQNPLTHKNAKFIPEISWKDFYLKTSKIKFKPGQHFVLDQEASRIILENKITTYILGKDLKQLDNFLSNKKFRGTVISD